MTNAWMEIVNAKGDDDWLQTCELAMREIQRVALQRAAAKIRRAIPVHCVNDTDGDGDCAACARNPQALCRQPTEEGCVMASMADLIDPDKDNE